MLSKAHAFETEFHGRRADAKFRSNAVTVLEEDRVRLCAHSKKGCSGTPMFSSTGELLSILHGETKHRARKHSGTPSDEKWSSHVYVDRLRNFDNIQLWGDDFFECILALEWIDEEEVVNPSKELFKPNEEEEQVAESEVDMSFFGAMSLLFDPDLFDIPEDAESEKQAFASEDAMKFFDKAKKLCYEVNPAVFDKPYFKIKEVCNALLQHHQDQQTAEQEQDPMRSFTVGQVCNALAAHGEREDGDHFELEREDIRNALLHYRQHTTSDPEGANLFTDTEVCNALGSTDHERANIHDMLIGYHRRPNRTSISLEDVLVRVKVGEGQFTYKAYAASSESEN